MEKPMFYLGSCYLWTLMLIALTGKGMAVGLLTASLLAMCALLYGIVKKRSGTRKLKFFLGVGAVAAAACIAFLLQTALVYQPALTHADEEVEGTFLVTEVLKDSSSGAHRCVLKVEGGDPVRHLRLSTTTYRPRVGDVFSGTLKLRLLGEQDPAVARYYKSRGLYLGAVAEGALRSTTFTDAAAEGQLDPSPPRLAWWKLRLKLTDLREHMTEQVEERLGPEDAAVLNGMLVGDKSALPEDTNTALKRAGVLHLFAVSGFHVSLWAMLWYKFLLHWGAGRRTAAGSAILFLFLFVALTGFSRSAVRAGIMLGVFFLGRLTVRSPEPLNSLGTAALCILLPNPFYGGDTGILLSYFATLGILALYPPLMEHCRGALKEKLPNYKVRKRVQDGCAVLLISLSTFLATLPVVTLSFGAVSLVSLLSNLMVSAASSAAILLTGAGALCGLVPVLSLMTPWCLLGSGLLARFLVAACRTLASWPFAYVSLTGRGFGLGLVAALVLATAGFVLYGSLPDKGLVRLTALLCTVLLLSSVLLDTAIYRDAVKVFFPDVKGTCIVLTYRHGATLIGVGGDEYETDQALKDLFQREGVTEVSTVVIPREKGTENGALDLVKEQYAPGLLLEPEDFTGPDLQTIRLLPETALQLFRQDGEYPAALLNVQGVPFLLLFRPTVEVSALPEGVQRSPVCFIRGNRPEGLKLTPSSYIIVSGESGEIEARVRSGRVRLYRW